MYNVKLTRIVAWGLHYMVLSSVSQLAWMKLGHQGALSKV